MYCYLFRQEKMENRSKFKHHLQIATIIKDFCNFLKFLCCFLDSCFEDSFFLVFTNLPKLLIMFQLLIFRQSKSLNQLKSQLGICCVWFCGKMWKNQMLFRIFFRPRFCHSSAHELLKIRSTITHQQ